MPSSPKFQFSPQDRIVLIMGPTGAGKSTFINVATKQTSEAIGHELRSQTTEIRATRVTSDDYDCPLVFIDTPGFNDTYKSDVEILSMIAEWLVETYKEKVNLATIIYLHRISDNRMTGSALKNLEVFASLCGQKAMPHVILATTMWDELKDKNTGVQREKELKTDFWKGMLADGCRTERFDNTYESAWHIVGSLAKKDRAPVLLQREIVDIQLRLNETQAGKTLYRQLDQLIKDHQDATRKLGEQANKQGNALVVQELNARKAEIDEKIQQTSGQLRQLKISFARRFVMFFKSWSY